MNISLQVSKNVCFFLTGLALPLAFVSLTSLNAQSNPGQAPPITRPDQIFLNVNITSSVSNEGKILAGLPEEKFSLYLGKELQKINHFTNKSLPASVLILFDLTRSMRPHLLYKYKGATKEAFTRFFKASDQANEYALLSFGGMAKPVQDWTGDTNAILDGFDNIASDTPSGTFNLIDRCLEGIENLRSRSHPRRAIVIVTDMYGDPDSNPSRLRRPLQETNSLIYLVWVGKLGSRSYFDTILDTTGEIQIQQMAELSGGMALFPKTAEDFGKGLQWIATDLSNQYQLGFQPPTSVKAGKEYPLKVTVKFSPGDPKEVKQMKVRHRQFFIGQNK